MSKAIKALIVCILALVVWRSGLIWIPPPSAKGLQGVVTSGLGDGSIPETYMVAMWKQDTGLGGLHCIHIEVTRVDVDGRYFIPEWEEWRRSIRTDLEVFAYSPGNIATPKSEHRDKWTLTQFKDPPFQYLKYLDALPFDCGAKDKSDNNGVTLWTAMLRDAIRVKKLASLSSEYEHRTVNSLNTHFATRAVDPTFSLDSNTRYEKAGTPIDQLEAKTSVP